MQRLPAGKIRENQSRRSRVQELGGLVGGWSFAQAEGAEVDEKGRGLGDLASHACGEELGYRRCTEGGERRSVAKEIELELVGGDQSAGTAQAADPFDARVREIAAEDGL